MNMWMHMVPIPPFLPTKLIIGADFAVGSGFISQSHYFSVLIVTGVELFSCKTEIRIS